MQIYAVLVLAATTLCASASSAFADEAVTYAGTLGKASIIVELQDPGKDGAFFGRYSYMSKGIDIPLHGKASGGNLTIEEEKPCTEKLCRSAGGDVVADAPIGAEWSLKADGAGSGLEGPWTDRASGKSLPITLTRKGERTLEGGVSSVDMLDPSYSSLMDDGYKVITVQDLPYDFLKLDHPLKQGKAVAFGDGTYRMDLDSRVDLDYPTVLSLGKADHAALDRGLENLRLRWVADAFWCFSRTYLGYGWSGSGGEGTNGYEGGAQVKVDYLTSRLMVITESGSQYCGGAHPNNFETHELIDARTGELLTSQDFMKGWVARDPDGNIVDGTKVADPSTVTWGPDDKLVRYVLAHRQKNDAELEKECGYPDLVRTNLGVYFKGDKMILALVDLPNVTFACGGDLYEIPLKDARRLLTTSGASYFTELTK